MSDRKSVIEALNEALKIEMGSHIQNVTQGAVLQGMDSLTLRPLFEKMAEENLRHAAVLRERIFFLGGTPTMDVGARQVARDTKEVISINLKEAKDVVDHYRAIFKMLPKDEEGSKLFEVIEDILESEYEDLETFQRLAGQV